MIKTTTTINTLSELKNPEKIIGLCSRVKLNVNIHGVYNLPDELKLKNQFQVPYDFELYIFGNLIQGGQFQQRNATEKELNKLRESLPKAKWKDLDLTLLEPQIDTSDGYNSAKFQQLEDINFFPQIKFKQKHKEFEFQQKNLVNLEETICNQKSTKIWLLAIPQLHQQEVLRQLQKIKDVSQFQYFETQIFEGIIDFEKMLQNDETSLTRRIFLNSKNSNYINSKNKLYINIDLKIDFSFSSIMKRKFQYQIKLIVDQFFIKKTDYQKTIKNQFQNLLQNYFEQLKSKQKIEKSIDQFLLNQKNSDKENYNNIKKNLLYDYLSSSKNDVEHLNQDFKQIIYQYVQHCSVQDNNIKTELYKDDIYKQCLDFFKNIYIQYSNTQRGLFKIQNKMTINSNNFDVDQQQLSEEEKISKIQEQKQMYYVYKQLKNQRFEEICLQKLESLNKDSQDLKKFKLDEYTKKQRFDLAEIEVLTLIRDNTQNFDLQFLLTLIFYQQRKLKETVLMIKYLKETYQQKQIPVNLLILILLMEFSDNDNISKLIQAKNFRLVEQQKDINEGFQRKFFDIYQDENMEQKIQLEQVQTLKQKITKTQQEPIDQESLNQKKIQHETEILNLEQKNLKKVIKLCLDYNLIDNAYQFLKLVSDKDVEYYKYKYKINKYTNKQQSIFKCLENILMQNQNPIYLIEGLIQLDRFELLHEKPAEEMIEQIIYQYNDLDEKQKIKFLIFYGKYLSKSQDQSNALEIYDFAISQFPKISYFWQCLGKCFYKNQNFQKARQYFEQANLLFPYDDKNLIYFYQCCDKLGEEKCYLIKILKEIKKAGISQSQSSNKFIQYLQKNDQESYKFLMQQNKNSQLLDEFLLQQLIK